MVVILILAGLILAPIAGGLLAGVDRVISARMQGRKGPPLLQPFYDVIKLFQKEPTAVNRTYRFYIYASILFTALTAVIIIAGGDILLAVFALTLGSVFFVLGGYASRSPYSLIGAERETLQIMAYEPMVLITAISLYYVNKSFFVSEIISSSSPAIIWLPGIFVGFIFILTFKLRKSPFDFSMSHHGHQEIVKGITTEFSGRDLAIIEITHWYENIIALAFVYLFFAASNPLSHLLAVVVCLAVYFLEILIDNTFARIKWQQALKSAWIITAVLGTANLLVLSYLK